MLTSRSALTICDRKRCMTRADLIKAKYHRSDSLTIRLSNKHSEMPSLFPPVIEPHGVRTPSRRNTHNSTCSTSDILSMPAAQSPSLMNEVTPVRTRTRTRIQIQIQIQIHEDPVNHFRLDNTEPPRPSLGAHPSTCPSAMAGCTSAAFLMNVPVPVFTG